MFGWSTVVVWGMQDVQGWVRVYILVVEYFMPIFNGNQLTFQAKIWYAESLNELAV